MRFSPSGRREWPTTLLLLLPGFAVFLGLFVYPFIITIIQSLRPEGETTGWTLEYYGSFLSSPHGRQVIGLTFFLAVATTFFFRRPDPQPQGNWGGGH